MATLILGALGTALGGPLGGALGSLAGRQIDGQILGGGRREGPRLKDLAITTSTYGRPIARTVGRMRLEGTIVWATDLQERSETSGGKGQPKTTRYSYAISLAVMLASHPVDGIGRIWADGNLLRGAAGDLKTGGAMRFYTGHGDQPPDPLIQAALGSPCPAYRGRAYVVFEDLQLEDFGNRIPALSFEVFAGSGDDLLAALLEPVGGVADPGAAIPGLGGFAIEGGAVAQSLALFDRVQRLIPDTIGSPLRMRSVAEAGASRDLAEPIAAPEGDFGRAAGTRRQWQSEDAEAVAGLRYYDIARDYQPGVQRHAARAPSGPERLLEFPAALSPQAARALAERVAGRPMEDRERLRYRTAELDPAVGPGALVRLAGSAANWLVEAWEWCDSGVELELVRHFPRLGADQPASPGAPWLPRDRLPGATLLHAFELPWDGVSPRGAVYAALSAQAGRWAGATIQADRGGALIPLATAGPARAVMGRLLAPLGSSPSLMLEEQAQLRVRLADPAMELAPTTRSGIADGANRLLVGEEILQYRDAVEPTPGEWILTGLLRGRGGTEGAALEGLARMQRSSCSTNGWCRSSRRCWATRTRSPRSDRQTPNRSFRRSRCAASPIGRSARFTRAPNSTRPALCRCAGFGAPAERGAGSIRSMSRSSRNASAMKSAADRWQIRWRSTKRLPRNSRSNPQRSLRFPRAPRSGCARSAATAARPRCCSRR